MPVYAVSGLMLDVKRPLEGIAPAEDVARIDFEVVWPAAGSVTQESMNWVYEPPATHGGRFLSVGRLGHRHYHLRFWERADFTIDVDRGLVTVTPVADIAAESVTHLLLDQVVPRLALARGALVLHASAVRLGSSVCGFLGTSGAGKSTMALAMARRGHPLVCDDALVVTSVGRTLQVVASYEGLRLWDDAARQLLPECVRTTPAGDAGKVRTVSGMSFAGGVHRLGRLFELRQDEVSAPSIEAVPAREAMLLLTEHGYHLDPNDTAELSATFNARAELADAGLVRRLRYRSDLSALDQVCELIERSAVE